MGSRRVPLGHGTGRCHNLEVLFVHTVVEVSMLAGVNTDAPGYDLVLLAHVLTSVIGLVVVVATGASALVLRRALVRGGPMPESLVRYFRPGVNWAGRVLFLVPILGVALLAMSGGQWGLGDIWVSLGLAVWAVVAVAAEAVLWPAERRLQEVVSMAAASPGRGVVPSDGAGDGADPAGLCLRAGMVGLGLGAALVLVGVLMVAKP